MKESEGLGSACNEAGVGVGDRKGRVCGGNDKKGVELEEAAVALEQLTGWTRSRTRPCSVLNIVLITVLISWSIWILSRGCGNPQSMNRLAFEVSKAVLHRSYDQGL